MLDRKIKLNIKAGDKIKFSKAGSAESDWQIVDSTASSYTFTEDGKLLPNFNEFVILENGDEINYEDITDIQFANQ